MSRTYRQPYSKSKAFDSSCRCHGGCPWCLGNRQHKNHKGELSAKEQIKEYQQDKQ